MSGPSRRTILASAMAASAAVAFGPGREPAAMAADGPGQAHRVEIRGFAFSPDRLAVAPGDIVTWTNHDIAPHTATANDHSWDTGTIGTGETKSLRITADTELAYFCRFHPMMTATLVWRPDD